MKHMSLGEAAKEMVLGEGSAALSLLVGVIALALFPIPVVVYIFYLTWLAYVIDQARRWLRPLLTTWPRLIVCVAFSVGCIAAAWQLPIEPGSLIEELRAVHFSYWTLMFTGVFVFWLCVGVAKELWQARSNKSTAP